MCVLVCVSVCVLRKNNLELSVEVEKTKVRRPVERPLCRGQG